MSGINISAAVVAAHLSPSLAGLAGAGVSRAKVGGHAVGWSRLHARLPRVVAQSCQRICIGNASALPAYDFGGAKAPLLPHLTDSVYLGTLPVPLALPAVELRTPHTKRRATASVVHGGIFVPVNPPMAGVRRIQYPKGEEVRQAPFGLVLSSRHQRGQRLSAPLLPHLTDSVYLGTLPVPLALPAVELQTPHTKRRATASVVHGGIFVPVNPPMAGVRRIQYPKGEEVRQAPFGLVCSSRHQRGIQSFVGGVMPTKRSDPMPKKHGAGKAACNLKNTHTKPRKNLRKKRPEPFDWQNWAHALIEAVQRISRILSEGEPIYRAESVLKEKELKAYQERVFKSIRLEAMAERLERERRAINKKGGQP